MNSFIIQKQIDCLTEEDLRKTMVSIWLEVFPKILSGYLGRKAYKLEFSRTTVSFREEKDRHFVDLFYFKTKIGSGEFILSQHENILIPKPEYHISFKFKK